MSSHLENISIQMYFQMVFLVINYYNEMFYLKRECPLMDLAVLHSDAA